MTTMTTMAIDRDALVDRLHKATVGALELFSVYIGDRLGLYVTLGEHADLSAEELSEGAGIHPRHAREWLERQAVAGFVTVSGNEEADRRFSLPAPHREVLAEPDNPAFLAPFGLLVVGIAQTLPDVVEAYRAGRKQVVHGG